MIFLFSCSGLSPKNLSARYFCVIAVLGLVSERRDAPSLKFFAIWLSSDTVSVLLTIFFS